MRPNLFDFATSELSQDAVLCWILAWADLCHKATNSALHQVGFDLVNQIFQRQTGSRCPHVTSITVRRQVKNIDILCEVNEEWAIVIEDKTGTTQHSDQLARYKAHVSEKLKFPAEKVVLVYVQTGDQSDYQGVSVHGYLVITRSCLLDILESPNGLAARSISDTLQDFGVYLRKIEDDVQSFRTTQLDKWTGNAWRGFYCELQKHGVDGHWRYVANPSGGFWAFFWHFEDFEGGQVYLQLEQHKFCFKISVEEPTNQFRG